MSWRTVPSVNCVGVPSFGLWPGCAEGFCRAGPAGNEGKRLMSWTDERVELLKKLWQDGLSASQIAGELGGVTRNAVIGKVHRLGLSGRATPSKPARPAFKTPRPARPAATTMPSAPRRVIAAEPAPLPAVAQHPPVPAFRAEEP